MNLHAIRAIYAFEMARTWRTVTQSIISPVLSTALYFVVFGSAIGSRIAHIGDVSYAAFIVPGLIMLSVLTQSIANASFGIYFPKFTGTIYELLSAPISHVEIVFSYVGAAATKSVLVGLIILATASVFVPLHIAHPVWMILFLILTAVTFSLFGFIIGIWADGFEKLQLIPMLLGQHAAAAVAEALDAQPLGLSDQRLPLELFRHLRDARRHQLLDDRRLLLHRTGGGDVDHEDRVAAEGLRG
jgi:ABC-2 type transport system permease protein